MREMFDVIENIECCIGDLDKVHTLLSEAAHDVDPIILFDGSKEDKTRISNLLNRRPVLSNLLSIMVYYVIQIKDSLKKEVEACTPQAGGGRLNIIN